MTKLSPFADLVSGDHGLAVVSVSRPDGTVASSVVNAGVLSHPVTGAEVVGLVAASWPGLLAGPAAPMPG